ncbi:MAG: hypothetical protein Q9217_006591 [Psora testacea]
MDDPLLYLPTERQISILESVEDLPALSNTLAASPSAKAVFAQQPGQIFAAVTSTFPKELQQTIRAVIVTLCDSSFHCPLVEDEVLSNRENSFNTTTGYEDSLPPISFDLPLPALRQSLDLAKRIYLIATLFLKTHLARLNNLRPQHLAKQNFVFSSYPFRKYPEGRSYIPNKTGLPTWVEEYRVRRALWRLQFFCLMTTPNARVQATEEPHFIECSIAQRQHEFNRIWGSLTKWEIDEILGVQDFLEETRISLRAPPSFTDSHPFSPSANTPTSDTTSSSPLSMRSKDPSAHVPPPKSLDPLPRLPSLPPPTTFQPTPSTEAQASKYLKDQDFIAIKRSTEAYNFFHRYGLRHPTSPLQRSKWDHYRHMGFGIWDQERMCAMELSRLPAALRDERRGNDITIDNMAFTWRSIEGAGVGDALNRSTTNREARGGAAANGLHPEALRLSGLKNQILSPQQGSMANNVHHHHPHRGSSGSKKQIVSSQEGSAASAILSYHKGLGTLRKQLMRPAKKAMASSNSSPRSSDEML